MSQRHNILELCGCLLMVWMGPTAAAQAGESIIAVTNLTEDSWTFELAHPTAADVAPQTVTVPGRMTIRCLVGREPEIRLTLNGQPTRYRLDPFAAYYYALGETNQAVFAGIELVAPLPLRDEPPLAPVQPSLWTIPVILAIEDSDPRKPEAAAAAYQERILEVSKRCELILGIRLSVARVVSYAQPQDSQALAEHLSALEQAVPGEPEQWVIGFTQKRWANSPAAGAANAPALDPARGSASRGPFGRHIILNEPEYRSEMDRIEVLFQEVARLLGAVGSPDSRSAVRKNLGNGQAILAKNPIQLDPINLLITHIWKERKRRPGGKDFKDWSDFTPTERDRLLIYYKTMTKLGSEDPRTVNHTLSLESTLPEFAAKPKPTTEPNATASKTPQARPPEPELEPLAPEPTIAPPTMPKLLPGFTQDRATHRQAARTILAELTEYARSRQTKTAAERLKADALTAAYVRRAAKLALALETRDDSVRVHGFLVALGLALDDSQALFQEPLTRPLVQDLETEAARQARRGQFGLPTVRGRPDLCQHLFLSATLTALLGPGPAEAIGLTKELADMKTNSGFSFQDLAADLAGIEFAKLLMAQPQKLKLIAEEFQVEQIMPTLTGLREGLSPRWFEQDYGSLQDERFIKAIADIRRRVVELQAKLEPK